MSINPEKASQPAYILWLIRTQRTRNLAGLYAHFGESFGGPENIPENSSFPYILDRSLASLVWAGLIHAGNWQDAIQLTPLAERVREVLGVSLTDLAIADPKSSLRVAPLFGPPRTAKCGTDLFVLMPFRPELRPVYEDHIKRVASQLGITVKRADDFFTTGSVMDEIWSTIAGARTLVAECTGRNANVFYEIGIAHTIGKPVVLITQDPTDVPFDLRHRRYIEYHFTPRGMTDFEDRLARTIAEILTVSGESHNS